MLVGIVVIGGVFAGVFVGVGVFVVSEELGIVIKKVIWKVA